MSIVTKSDGKGAQIAPVGMGDIWSTNIEEAGAIVLVCVG